MDPTNFAPIADLGRLSEATYHAAVATAREAGDLSRTAVLWGLDPGIKRARAMAERTRRSAATDTRVRVSNRLLLATFRGMLDGINLNTPR